MHCEQTSCCVWLCNCLAMCVPTCALQTMPHNNILATTLKDLQAHNKLATTASQQTCTYRLTTNLQPTCNNSLTTTNLHKHHEQLSCLPLANPGGSAAQLIYSSDHLKNYSMTHNNKLATTLKNLHHLLLFQCNPGQLSQSNGSKTVKFECKLKCM